MLQHKFFTFCSGFITNEFIREIKNSFTCGHIKYTFHHFFKCLNWQGTNVTL